MPELIDRNELRRTICAACAERLQCTELGNVCFEVACVNNAPTIEAEPVKHAYWESCGYVFHGIEWKRCSACGKCAGVSYYGLLDGKIEMETPAQCGCCGARMDLRTPTEVQLDEADDVMMEGTDNG